MTFKVTRVDGTSSHGDGNNDYQREHSKVTRNRYKKNSNF